MTAIVSGRLIRDKSARSSISGSFRGAMCETADWMPRSAWALERSKGGIGDDEEIWTREAGT